MQDDGITGEELLQNVGLQILRTGNVSLLCQYQNQVYLDETKKPCFTMKIRLEGAISWVTSNVNDIFRKNLQKLVPYSWNISWITTMFASDGTKENSHSIRRTSTVEYYQLAGYKKHVITYTKYNKEHPQEREMLFKPPSWKFSSILKFKEASTYFFTHYKKITGYYNNDLWGNKARLKKYIIKQRATLDICKHLLDGSKKYSPTALPQQETLKSSKEKWRSRGSVDDRIKPLLLMMLPNLATFVEMTFPLVNI
ncbi:hypothetical protein K501DRAFT_336615 [Backusella circina FSU 941]|nr:hypothetical protein K501DRAFT_336615 [Backusella circina FSU 941]